MTPPERRASVSLGARGWLRALPAVLAAAALLVALAIGWRALSRKLPAPAEHAAPADAPARPDAARGAEPGAAAPEAAAEAAPTSQARRGAMDSSHEDLGVVEVLDVLEALGDVPEKSG